MELFYAVDWIDIVTFVFFGSAHISLCVNRVVVLPIGGSSHSYTSFEYGAAFAHGHERVKSAETPAPNADAVFVNIGECAQILCCLNLIFGLQFTKFQIGAFFKLRAASTRAASIDDDEDVALLVHVAFPDAASAETYLPVVGHFLRARTAILVHDDGILLCGVEVFRFLHPAIELNALARSEGKELLLTREGRHLFFQLFVVQKCRQCLSVAIAQSGNIRCSSVRPHVHKVVEIFGEGSAVRTCFSGEFARTSVFIVHIYRTAQRAFLCRLIIAVARFRVVAIERRHVVVALRERPHELSVEIVEINVLVAGAIRDKSELSWIESQGIVGTLLNIFSAILAQSQFGFR